MTVKDFFYRGRDLENEIKELKSARREAYELAIGSGAGGFDEKVQTSRGNLTERKILSYIEYSLEIDKRISYLSEYRQKMLMLINKVDNSKYRTLLISRYINCNTWEKIAEDMGYSDVWVRRQLHSKALQEAEKYYKNFFD